jgi:hypothetical protein
MRALLIALVLIVAAIPAAAQKACDQFRSATTTAPQSITETIPGIDGQRIYLCGFTIINTGSGLTVSLFSGTGTNCNANQTVLVAPITLPNNSMLVNRIAIAAGEYTPQGHALCVQVTGTGNLTTLWYWTQF